MINIEDIKVNNYFRYYNNAFEGYVLGVQVSTFSSSSNKVAISVKGGGWLQLDISDLNEIAVTPEILVRCGFTVATHKNIIFWYINRTDYHIKLTGEGFEIYLDELDTKVICSGTGLHELQNIWYYLTKTKLNFN